MFCTKCGYALTSQNTQCPRCVQLGATSQQPTINQTAIPNKVSIASTTVSNSRSNMIGWQIAGILAIVVFSASLRSCSQAPASTSSGTASSTQPRTPVGPAFNEVDAKMDDRLNGWTEAQKQSYWSSVTGTEVTWSGEVTEVEITSGGNIRMKCNPKTWSSDVTVDLDGSQLDKLPLINKGQQITIVGILQKHGFTGYTVSQGHVINL